MKLGGVALNEGVELCFGDVSALTDFKYEKMCLYIHLLGPWSSMERFSGIKPYLETIKRLEDDVDYIFPKGRA